MRINIRSKLIVLGCSAALLPTAMLSGLLLVQGADTEKSVKAELDVLAHDNIGQIAHDVYDLCFAAYEMVKQRMASTLNVAEYVVERNGGARLASEEVRWNVVDPQTQVSRDIALPALRIGETDLGQNRDASAPTPVVDEIHRLVGGYCSIFQRVNERGDLLRVATNVKQADGSRAVGSYLPAVNTDGTPNPVVKALSSGQTFHGQSFVVNAWFQTAYQPLYDASGKWIGAVGVGVNQQGVDALREAILNIQVGKSGYVYVLGGTGADRGHYIISKDGKRDGEDILNAKDADGRLFIQEILEESVGKGPTETAFVRYPWKNQGETKARDKIAAVKYFEPWDWVIGASCYEDDYMVAKERVASALSAATWKTVVGGSVVGVLALVLSIVGSGFLSRRVLRMKQAAERIAVGDLHHTFDSKGSDEIDDLAASFQRMIDAQRAKAGVAAALSKGNLEQDVPVLSDQDELGRPMAQIRDSLLAMTREFQGTVRAAIHGGLRHRADSSRFEGEYRNLIEGLNASMDAVVGHLDAIDAPAMIIDKDFTVQYLNQTGERLCGLGGGKGAAGSKCYDLFRTSDCRTERCALARAMRDGRVTTSETDAHPNGQDLEVRYTGIPVRDREGAVIGALEVVNDQTAIKAAARRAEKQAAFQSQEVEKLVVGLNRMAGGDLELDLQLGAVDADTEEIGRNFEAIHQAMDRMSGAVRRLATDAGDLAAAAVAGDLAKRVEVAAHAGEYRTLMEGFNRTLDAVVGPIAEASKALEALANFDLRARVDGDYQGDHARIKESLNTAAAALDEALSQVAEAAQQLGSASDQIASSSQSVAQGASEQASSLEETSSSLEEMAGMTKQTADNTQVAKTLATTAKQAADQGNASMTKMNDSMRRIRQSAEATSEIINDINEVAFQTNLLALNAAVEAARAGDAGRGFAVVADEVRNLALRAKEAAEKTRSLLEESVKLARDGETISGEVSGNLGNIVESIGKVTEIVNEISAASSEQARGIDQVNRAVAEMDKVVQQAAANSEESSSAAQELASQAQELNGIVARFQLNGSAARPEAGSKPRLAALALKRPPTGGNGHGNGRAKTALSAVAADDARRLIPLDDDDELMDF